MTMRILLQMYGAAVLCVQCDPRKIVMGTVDRSILYVSPSLYVHVRTCIVKPLCALYSVHDLRSGRLVHSLHGHKVLLTPHLTIFKFSGAL